MKPTQLHKMLQLGVIFMCSSCGDKSRSETHQNDAAVQTSAPEAKAAQRSDKINQPTLTSDINESIKKSAEIVSSSRANGDVITALFEMHKLMKQWSPIGLPKDKLIE